jgi:hypothetical protein
MKMTRTRKITNAKTDERPLWRKVSSGTLIIHLDGQEAKRTRVKPRQEIHAEKEELGKWAEEFELLTPELLDSDDEDVDDEDVDDEDVDDEDENTDENEFQLEHLGGGWYNVVSSEEAVMNNSKLRKEDAEALIVQLNEEGE